ncbi:MAG: pobA 2 [Chloroflexi bacterium]|nr:pobA 2 [Chloroflexota bacterium]
MLSELTRTGPGTLNGRFMRTFWHPIARVKDLPAGRAKPLRIMGEDFTLYRGEGGAVHLLAFRCAHRGTQLSTGWVEGDDLRCFYHGWKYDGSGQCVEQPAEPEPFCARIKIRSYPVEEYLGLIFGYFGEGDPPPLMRYTEFEDESRGYTDTITSTTPCNLFNIVDNDPIHIYFVHSTFNASQGRADIPRVSCEETDFGYIATAADSVGSWIYNCYMPNMVHGRRDGSPKGEAIQWRVPIDDENVLNIGVNLIYLYGDEADAYRARTNRGNPAEFSRRVNEVGQRVLAGDLHISEVDDRSLLFNVQDYTAQVGCGSPVDLAHQHLGREDATATILRGMWIRELNALAAGRPLKRWTRPSEPMYLGNDERVPISV